MKTDAQKERIKRYLKSGKGLTPLGALNRFGCFRLSGRILDFRREGMNIQTVLVKRGKKRVALYRIADKGQEARGVAA